METLELISQLRLRFGSEFVDLFLLERRLRGLTLADNSDLLELEEEFRALALSTQAHNSELRRRCTAAADLARQLFASSD